MTILKVNIALNIERMFIPSDQHFRLEILLNTQEFALVGSKFQQYPSLIELKQKVIKITT